MKLILLALLTLASSAAFADKLKCLCTGPNAYRAEMSCKKFQNAADCHFEDRIENANVVWQKQFSATAQGILFSWSTNGGNPQEAVLKPGWPMDFKYYGDNDTYTMICDIEN